MNTHTPDPQWKQEGDRFNEPNEWLDEDYEAWLDEQVERQLSDAIWEYYHG